MKAWLWLLFFTVDKWFNGIWEIWLYCIVSGCNIALGLCVSVCLNKKKILSTTTMAVTHYCKFWFAWNPTNRLSFIVGQYLFVNPRTFSILLTKKKKCIQKEFSKCRPFHSIFIFLFDFECKRINATQYSSNAAVIEA